MEALIDILYLFFLNLNENNPRYQSHIIGKRAFKNSKKLTFRNLIVILLSSPVACIQSEIFRFCIFSGERQSGLFSKSWFIQIRKFIKPELFIAMNDELLELAREKMPFRLYKGKYLLVGADGSTIKIPKTEKNIKAFGSTKNQHGVQSIIRSEFMFNLQDKYCLYAKLGKSNSGEKAMLIEGLKRLKKQNAILVLDRLYTSIGLIILLEYYEIKYVIRSRKNWNTPLMNFLKTDSKDGIIQVKLSGRAYTQLQEWEVPYTSGQEVKVRVLRFDLKSNEEEILITNLFEDEMNSTELYGVYGSRWGTETGIDVLKNKVRLECFTGHLPENIKQDFHAKIVEYNLSYLAINTLDAELKEQDKDKTLKNNRQINKAMAINLLLRNTIPQISETPQKEDIRTLVEEMRVLLRFPEPIRPGRSFKRVYRRKPKGRFYTDLNYRPPC